MQIEVNEICMRTKFGGHGLSSFVCLQNGQIFMDCSPWGSRKGLSQKIHASRGWCESMCTKFGGYGFLVQRFYSFLFAFKTSKFSFRTMDYSPWGSKNTIVIPVFALLYFHEFRKICSVVKLNFMKMSPCHTFYVAHVDHPQKYFLQNYWNCHFCENLVTPKFPGIR